MSIRIQPEQRFRRLATVVVAWVLLCPLLSQAGQASSLAGAATLIRPDLSSLSVTDSLIKTVSDTNIDLVAVGQIPVLVTNIDYQIIFTAIPYQVDGGIKLLNFLTIWRMIQKGALRVFEWFTF